MLWLGLMSLAGMLKGVMLDGVMVLLTMASCALRKVQRTAGVMLHTAVFVRSSIIAYERGTTAARL